jgi:mercuric ion binding protein
MKRLVTLAALTVGVLVSGTAFAGEQTVKLAVANMSCATCPPIVRKSLSAVTGVSKVVVSLEQRSALVTFDDQKTNVQALIAATTNAGYPAKLVGQGS